MNLETAVKNLTAHGFSVRVFRTAQDAANAISQELSGKTVGFGGSVTLEQMQLFETLQKNNTVRSEQILTRGELCMFAFGWKTAARRIELVQTKTRVCRDVPCRHPYAAAIELALERGCMQQTAGRFFPDEPVSPEDFSGFCRALFAQETRSPQSPITHAQAIELLAAFAGREPL